MNKPDGVLAKKFGAVGDEYLFLTRKVCVLAVHPWEVLENGSYSAEDISIVSTAELGAMREMVEIIKLAKRQETLATCKWKLDEALAILEKDNGGN